MQRQQGIFPDKSEQFLSSLVADQRDRKREKWNGSFFYFKGFFSILGSSEREHVHIL